MTFNITGLEFSAVNHICHFQLMISDMTNIPCPWKGLEQPAFEQAYNRILDCINDQDLDTLFRLWLGAAFILDRPQSDWIRAFIIKRVQPHLLADLAWDDFEQGVWTRVPVLVAADETARVQWFMAGLVPDRTGPVHIPNPALDIMDARFRDQAETAQAIVRRMGPDPVDKRFVLFPLALTNDQVQMTGGSCALSFALAFKSLTRGQHLSPYLAVTGCLDHNGGIQPVACLDQKIKTASANEFKCLICPAGNRPAENFQTVIPAASFAQAWTVASLYSGRQDNLLFEFSKALADPGTFIDKMDSLPGDWLSREKQAVTDILNQIFENMDLFGRFTHKFLTITENFRLERAQALADLAPSTLPDQWPMAAIKWCTANLALANHQGQVKAAQTWETRGTAIADKVINLDISLAADFYNHALVSAHNRFEFYTSLPEPLFRLTAFMEKRLAMQVMIGAAGDPVMGRLFGTLVQNSAFNGPENIKHTEALSRKARQAFGEGLTPETESQWMRQYDYLTSARLAAGDIDGARESLKIYLDIESLEDIPAIIQDLSCWQTSLICRFLAMARPGNMKKIYLAMKPFAFDNFTPSHPWQLSFFNLGRTAMVLDDTQEATVLFEKSLEICLAGSSGPAIEIMALKALAFLEDLDSWDEKQPDLSLLEKRIKEAAAQLNPDWFSFLTDRPFPKALEYVRNNLARVFPFSYL